MVNPHFISTLEAYAIIRVGPGDFVKQAGYIDSTASTGVYYLQIFDSATLPPNGTPVVQENNPPAIRALLNSQKLDHTVGTDTRWDIDDTDGRASLGNPFAEGLVWCISTTRDTLTLAGAIASVTTLTL